MSLANPIIDSWTYDFGEKTKAQIDAQTVSINAAIATAKSSASSMIGSGNYGPTGGTYRVLVRMDPTNPGTANVSVQQVTT